MAVQVFTLPDGIFSKHSAEGRAAATEPVLLQWQDCCLNAGSQQVASKRAEGCLCTGCNVAVLKDEHTVASAIPLSRFFYC